MFEPLDALCFHLSVLVVNPNIQDLLPVLMSSPDLCLPESPTHHVYRTYIYISFVASWCRCIRSCCNCTRLTGTGCWGPGLGSPSNGVPCFTRLGCTTLHSWMVLLIPKSIFPMSKSTRLECFGQTAIREHTNSWTLDRSRMSCKSPQCTVLRFSR